MISNYDEIPWSGNAHVMLAHRADEDIPFSRRLADCVFPCWQKLVSDEISCTSEADFRSRQRHFCLRYGSVNDLYVEFDVSQGVELGAGFTTRGIEAASEGRLFFESDVASVIDAKRPAVEAILGENSRLTLNSLDLCDERALRTYLSSLTRQRTAFILEGLWPWIDWDVKRRLMTALHSFLKTCTGVVILTDIYSISDIEPMLSDQLEVIKRLPPNMIQQEMERFKQHREREEASCFSGCVAIQSFFQQLGFRVRVVNLCDVTIEYHLNDHGLLDTPVENSSEDLIWILEA